MTHALDLKISQPRSPVSRAASCINLLEEAVFRSFMIIDLCTRYIRYFQVDPDSSSSILSETLNYWKEMNLSALFQEVDRKLSKYTSLTQVIFNQTEIVNILSEFIPRDDVLSRQPMLELLAALATDLQQEFTPNLKSFLQILMSGPFKIR